MSREGVTLVVVALYLLACLVLGARALRATKDQRDFFVAGRRLTVLPAALGLFASNFSGFAFVGGPGLVYSYGLSSLWMLICAPLSVVLVFAWLGPRLRKLAGDHDLHTLPEVLGLRYRSRAVLALAALAVLAGVVGYFAVQVLAMAQVAHVLLEGAGLTNGAALWPLVLAAAGILILYCTLGGVLASIYTDVLQGLVMITASVAVGVVVAFLLPEGLAGVAGTVARGNPEAMRPFGSLGLSTGWGWFLLFGVGAIGQPHYVSKIMMVRRSTDLGRILWLLLVAMTLASLIWVCVGLAMRAEVLRGTQPDDLAPDRVSAVFLQSYTAPWLAGVITAGLFAAIMSSADAFLNVGAAALSRDLPRAFGRPPAVGGLLGPRLATIGLGAAAAVLALSWNDLVGLLGARSWALFAAAIMPSLGFGLLWPPPSARPALASILVGATLVLAPLDLPWGLSQVLLALPASMIVWLVLALGETPRGAAGGASR